MSKSIFNKFFNGIETSKPASGIGVATTNKHQIITVVNSPRSKPKKYNNKYRSK